MPGGWHMISSPASSGSSSSTSTRLASPPPNRCLKRAPKLRLTSSKAASRRPRPSRFRLAMPWRSFLIASSRSSRSPVSVSDSSRISRASSSARRLTGAEAVAGAAQAVDLGVQRGGRGDGFGGRWRGRRGPRPGCVPVSACRRSAAAAACGCPRPRRAPRRGRGPRGPRRRRARRRGRRRRGRGARSRRRRARRRRGGGGPRPRRRRWRARRGGLRAPGAGCGPAARAAAAAAARRSRSARRSVAEARRALPALGLAGDLGEAAGAGGAGAVELVGLRRGGSAW